MAGAGKDAAWASLTRLNGAPGQEGSNARDYRTVARDQCSRAAAQFVPGAGHDQSVQSRTAILLIFSVRLPSVTSSGRWREGED
jgi:hypothetical protein